MATEAKVAGHYTRGQLEETILRAMAQMGKDTAHLVAADLAPIDLSGTKWNRSATLLSRSDPVERPNLHE